MVNVVSLFTKIPIYETLDIVLQRLNEDNNLGGIGKNNVIVTLCFKPPPPPFQTSHNFYTKCIIQQSAKQRCLPVTKRQAQQHPPPPPPHPLNVTMTLFFSKIVWRCPLKERTSIENICSLTKLRVLSSYFEFENQFYKQLEGATLGSPLSPALANGTV